MTSRIIGILLAAVFSLTTIAQTTEKLSSPDGRYAFQFVKKNGSMSYTLSFDGKTIVEESRLGIDIANRLFESALGIPRDTCRDWCANLELKSVDRTSKDQNWIPLYGENAVIRDRYNQMTIHLTKGGSNGNANDNGYDKRKFYAMDIVVRAYNEGVALRYHFPETSNGLFLNIRGERTEFALPAGTEAWWEEWAQGPYDKKPLSLCTGEAERPLLTQHPDGTYVALLEAGLTDYARGKFANSNGRLHISMYDGAEVMSPYSTPWRVIMAGHKATDLINNKELMLNLNPECRIRDVSFIRPGKAFRSGRLDKKSIMKSIDFCSERGISYVELDAGWYGPEVKMASSALKVSSQRDFSMPEICRYAREKGVGVWVYVNQRALYNQLDSILPLYKEWGIKGIKFGFVQVGNQQWTTWLHRAVARCADFGLMVDIHDEYRPTGVSRTYPNLLTQEGIRGNEEMPDSRHNVTLPFSRFLCGPADYTLCYFNSRVKNTKAHQLAMAAVYYSPLQFLYWYDRPEDYRGEKEMKFWDDIPTVWDESIALDGQPGEYIVQARRSGNEWFVGAMNGLEERDLTVNTDFLGKGRYTVEIYNDDPKLNTRTRVSAKTINIKAGKSLKLHLQPSGGAALHFKTVK